MEALQKLEIRCRDLENTVRDYEQKLKIIMNNVPDIVYMLDPDGYIVFISDSIIQYGYDPGELIGTSIMELIHPLDKLHAAYRIKERRTGERKTKSYEVRMLTKGKTCIPVEIKSRDIESTPVFTITAEGYYCPTKKETRKFLGTVGVARDINELNYKEEKSRQKNAPQEPTEELIPICSNCKKIRDSEGKWKHLETYFGEVYDIKFTHSICTECTKILYPDIAEFFKKNDS